MLKIVDGLKVLQFSFEDGPIGYRSFFKDQQFTTTEQTLHEVVHLTTLGLDFMTWPKANGESCHSDWIANTIKSLTPSESKENEIRTLAAEVRILRLLKSFTDTGEHQFLCEIQRDQRSPGLYRQVLLRAEGRESIRDACLSVANILSWAEPLAKGS